MARRVSVPSADELFRGSRQQPQADTDDTAGLRQPGMGARPRAAVHAVPDPEPDTEGLRRPSGRVKHDEKVTVYVTAAELLEIEHARLSLRSKHGLVVDRGRLVREALALVLADLEANGETSALVARLTSE